MDAVALANLAAYSAQVAVIALVGSMLPVIFRVREPVVRYVYWRALLALCLLLPWLPVHPPVDAEVSAGATLMPFQQTADLTIGGPAIVGRDWLLLVTIVLVTGVLARVAWLVVGYSRLRRLRCCGEAADIAFAEVQDDLGTHADIRYVDGLRQPVTFGLARAVVLLPGALRAQPSEIQQAVVMHELCHVQRRDWAWVVAEEVVRSLLWFHPGMWWLIARVRLAREEVVDALVVMRTGQRQAYVRALMTFADEVPLAPAPAFAWRRHLFWRIVLVSTEDTMSTKRLVASCGLMAVLVGLGSWYAIAAFPLAQVSVATPLQSEAGPLERVSKPPTPENPIPRRVRDEVPVHPGDPKDMSVRITVRTTIDEAGAVAEARVVGLALATKAFQANIAASDTFFSNLEKFYNATFKATPDAQPPTSTFRPALEAFMQSAVAAAQQWRYDAPNDAPITFDSTIHFAGGPVADSGDDTPRWTPDGELRVGGPIRTPHKIRNVSPQYPPEAREANVQGVVIIEARLEPDGRVGRTRVLRSIPLLDQAAIDAVRQWEFTPTIVDGIARPVVMTVTVQFRAEPR